MNQKVITIALIVFALIFIVLLAVMMGTVTEKTNTANAQLVDTLAITEGTDVTQLDDQEVKGNYVISTINNGKSSGSKAKMGYLVKTNSNTDYVSYGYATASGGSSVDIASGAGSTGLTSISLGTDYSLYNVSDSSNDNYINETDMFKLNVLKNANDVIVGVAFTQVAP